MTAGQELEEGQEPRPEGRLSQDRPHRSPPLHPLIPQEVQMAMEWAHLGGD